MRILHLDSGREMRGGQWQALRLAQGLAQSGIECVVLARAASPLFRKASEAGLETHPLSLAALARFSRRVNLAHAHDARAHTWAALFSAAPVVVSRRVDFPIRSRWKYSRAAHFLAVSQCVRQRLLAAGVPAERVSVVYDGVPLRAPVPTGPRVLAPATSDPRKGSDLLAEAARQAGIQVRFSEDLEADLPGSALFVYITRSEGLGSGVLLAMAAGVPVLASDVGGLPEIVRHGENGWLTENQPGAIAAALRALLAGPEPARRLAAAARRTVEEKFSLEILVRDTIQVYRRVLSC
ncbi:MAG TPA: glycosyltransferase [Bryobacteraceae bacterium]|nr:glycosyltransferase [Bryobacteraceae bacterium]